MSLPFPYMGSISNHFTIDNSIMLSSQIFSITLREKCSIWHIRFLGLKVLSLHDFGCSWRFYQNMKETQGIYLNIDLEDMFPDNSIQLKPVFAISYQSCLRILSLDIKMSCLHKKVILISVELGSSFLYNSCMKWFSTRW